MNVLSVGLNQNNTKIGQKALLASAGGILAASLPKQNSTVNPEKREIRIKRETPFYTDVAGGFHKKTTEVFVSNDGKTRTLTETEVDGSKIVRNFTFDDNHKPLERVCKKISKNGVIEFISNHKTFYDGEISTTVITNKNFQTNTETVTTNINGEFKSEVVKKYNPKTGKNSFEIIEKSPVAGILNSKIIDENGNVKIESIGIKGKDGSVTIKKDFESFDGTRTKYLYKSSDKGSEMRYQIFSNTGERLMSVDRESKQISSQRRFISLNGHGYSIEQSENGFSIKDLVSKEERSFKYLDIVRSEKDLTPDTISYINTLPADLILNLADRGIKIYTVDKPEDGSTFFGTEIKTYRDIYTLAHETGHAIDYSRHDDNCQNITQNVLYRKVFEDEKSEFKKNMSDVQADYISYFLMDYAGGRGVNAGVNESVAEANAILTDIPHDMYLKRSHYFQKYFPKSIAAASKLMLRDKISF